MIVNAKLLLPLTAIINSNFKFYLTGSRYFGTQKENSDYDFFVESSEKVEFFLIENNFRKIKEKRYKDTNTLSVYINDIDNIHVQLVVDINKKIMIQKILLKALKLNIINDMLLKSKHTWDLMYLAYIEFLRLTTKEEDKYPINKKYRRTK